MRPVLFRITFGETVWPVSSYSFFGIMAAVYMILTVAWMLRTKKIRLINANTRQVFLLSLSSIAAFFLGARLLYGLLYYQRIASDPGILWARNLKNFSLHGGLLLVLLLWFYVARRKKVSLFAMTDPLVFHVGISVAIMRLGCFLNGCCYGVPTDLPWGMKFSLADGNAITRIIGVNAVSAGLFGVELINRHPTQFYEMLVALTASLVVYIATRIKRANIGTGFSTALFGLIFSIGRFAVYFFRDFPSATSLSNFIRGPVVYGFSILVFGIVLQRSIQIQKQTSKGKI